MKGSSKPTRPVQMACLSIGFNDYLLPADKAMKVAELMQSSFSCDKRYADRGHQYTPREQPNISFEFVKASQVRPDEPVRGTPLLTMGGDGA